MWQSPFNGEPFIRADQWQSRLEADLDSLDQILWQPADVGDCFMPDFPPSRNILRTSVVTCSFPL